MEVLNIAVLDDESEFAKGLQNKLAVFFASKEKTGYNLITFPDSDSFIGSGKAIYDIIFLDAMFPALGGLETAKRIRAIDDDALIIFFTGMAGVYVNGYEVSAFDCLKKDISCEDFAAVMDRALAAIKKKDTCKFLAGSGDKVKVLNSREIVYVEVFTHDIVFHTMEGEAYHARNSLKNISAMLAKHHFVYAHRCYLINLRHVKEVKGNTVICGNETIKIGGKYKKALIEAVSEYFNQQS